MKKPNEMIKNGNCPECGPAKIITRMENDPVLYGENLIRIPCIVPVRKCCTCGIEYTDWEAEEIRGIAVKAYLESSGRKSPKR